jgi:hypothetical protein
MLSEPCLWFPLFFATWNCTAPMPVPLAPDMMVIHELLLVAVHAQLLLVTTATEPPPPLSLNDWLVGAMAKVHVVGVGPGVGAGPGAGVGAAPPCVTVNDWPAIAIDPVREAPLFGLTLNATTPLPLPFVPEEIPIHVAVLLALQEQPTPVDTVTVPVPPVAETL